MRGGLHRLTWRVECCAVDLVEGGVGAALVAVGEGAADGSRGAGVPLAEVLLRAVPPLVLVRAHAVVVVPGHL